MAKSTRQTAIFGAEDWKRIYKTFREADLQSYDFETLRKSFVDYLRLYYPETFNDFTESSEFVALLDIISFMGQGLSFRQDLNARENFIDTAERRDSVVKLANLVGYTPKRAMPGQGYLKIVNVSTTESVNDFNGNNLASVIVKWNDVSNSQWVEQFNAIMNAAFVDSQRVGRPGNSQDILGIKTDEYELRVVPGYLPVIGFESTVDGISMGFEATSATSVGKESIFEPAPQPDGALNILYRNDKLGFGSANTGFFFYFKQGTLQSQEFTIDERLANRTVNIDIDGINNEDVHLFQVADVTQELTPWTQVESIYATGANPSTGGNARTVYEVQSRANDQVTLKFGDGVFAKIPVGTFRVYTRVSNGLEYTINPGELSSITLSVPYTSRNGRNESLTFTAALTTSVTNAKGRETIAEIKSRAPAGYYTQNRMVNGEDYNNFPYTQFTSILKSKALARGAVGVNRQSDLLDPTGKYSSTNSFSSDGMLYQSYTTPSYAFNFVDRNDIATQIVNQLEPAIKGREMRHFYYDKFSRLSVTTMEWVQSTVLTNQTTGYFKATTTGDPVPVGATSGGNTKYIDIGGLIKFVPPSGQYFDKNNRLKTGTPSNPDEKMVIWATVTKLSLDGTNFGKGNLDNGLGPVVLNEYVPSAAQPTEIIPVFTTDLPTALETSIIEQVELYRNFGLRYNHLTDTWSLITQDNLDQGADWDESFAGDITKLQRDASWLIQFTTDGSTYTVNYRNLGYFFASVAENRFIYDDSTKIFDPVSGKTVNDFVSVVRTNSKPDSNDRLDTNVRLDIVGQEVETDGFIDNFKVKVSYADSDSDAVPDNPDIFTDLVAPLINPLDKIVFFETVTDAANLQRSIPLASGTIETLYTTKDSIENNKTSYIHEQVFYASTDKKFYQLSVVGTTYTITETLDYTYATGRQDLNFQYKHNSPNSKRIDPAMTNIVDLYVVSNSYYTKYTNWVKDTTDTVIEPQVPTIDELSLAYADLQNYKMVSDNLIVNSVTFKPLFGAKAPAELRGVIKVIKEPNTVISQSEIKTRVVEKMNQFFDINNWDFGDTFYFSELSAYIHREIGDIVNSVVVVPTDPTKSFGDLYEIRSAPNEIFVNAVTVNDIEVIDALTPANLRVSGNPTDVITATTQSVNSYLEGASATTGSSSSTSTSTGTAGTTTSTGSTTGSSSSTSSSSGSSGSSSTVSGGGYSY